MQADSWRYTAEGTFSQHFHYIGMNSLSYCIVLSFGYFRIEMDVLTRVIDAMTAHHLAAVSIWFETVKEDALSVLWQLRECSSTRSVKLLTSK